MNAGSIRSPLTALGLALTVLGGGILGSGCSKDTTSENVDVGVDSIIFVKRAAHRGHVTRRVNIDVSGGNSQVIDYDRYVPGGSLILL